MTKMDSIAQGAITLTSVAILLSIFSLITKEDQRIKYVSGVILTVYMLQFTLPIVRLITNVEFSPEIEQGDTENTPPSDNAVILNAISEQLCSDIKTLVISRFGIEESAFTVSVTLDTNERNEIELRSISLKHHQNHTDANDYDLELISKYISDAFAAPCIILTENG